MIQSPSWALAQAQIIRTGAHLRGDNHVGVLLLATLDSKRYSAVPNKGQRYSVTILKQQRISTHNDLGGRGHPPWAKDLVP